MNFSAEFARLREWTAAQIEKRIGHLVGWTQLAHSSPMGDQDFVSTEDGSSNQRPTRRLEPWGLRSVPVAGSRYFWIRLGSSTVWAVGIEPSKGYGPTDLEEGETALYCKTGGRVVKLDSSGILHLGKAGLGTTDGVVHGSGIDPFTGVSYTILGNTSSVVRVTKDGT